VKKYGVEEKERNRNRVTQNSRQMMGEDPKMEIDRNTERERRD